MLFVVGLAPATASAHSGTQSYLYVSIFDDGVKGRVEIPAVDLGPALGIELPTSPGELRTAVQAARSEIESYIAENTTLGADGTTWTLEYGDLSVLPTEKGPYIVLQFVVTDDFDAAQRDFVADFSVIIESNPERDALLLIEDDWGGATFNNGSGHLLGFSVGQTEQAVVLDNASTLSSMAAIRGVASDEVREGIDLLLLVAAVTAAMVLVPLRRDEATPRSLDQRARSAATTSGGVRARCHDRAVDRRPRA